LSLAAATGVLFGVTAGLAKVAANDLHRGVGEVVRDWPGYAALACAGVGFVLSQHAFRAGVAVAPSLAVMVVLNPLAGIGFGVLWLGERVHRRWWCGGPVPDGGRHRRARQAGPRGGSGGQRGVSGPPATAGTSSP
jgi:drug/metabolite transporter (DMT)-like permease